MPINRRRRAVGLGCQSLDSEGLVSLRGNEFSRRGGYGQKRAESHAVAIVSGGDATRPFTTPDQACAARLAAGNTATALREFALKQSYQVLTSPT